MLRFVLISWFMLFSNVSCHVSWTFPPARKYDLDFLDTARTKSKCGMERGELFTDLVAGDTINVTWHLGYVHNGGFKIELLDSNEKHVKDLTPVGKFVGDPSKKEAVTDYELKIPDDAVCKKCTLRLIRQAKEWGSSYKFKSCADINIISSDETNNQCSGHGQAETNNACKCQNCIMENFVSSRMIAMTTMTVTTKEDASKEKVLLIQKRNVSVNLDSMDKTVKNHPL